MVNHNRHTFGHNDPPPDPFDWMAPATSPKPLPEPWPRMLARGALHALIAYAVAMLVLTQLLAHAGTGVCEVASGFGFLRRSLPYAVTGLPTLFIAWPLIRVLRFYRLLDYSQQWLFVLPFLILVPVGLAEDIKHRIDARLEDGVCRTYEVRR